MANEMNRANKTVIITGGNSGLGYACAKSIAADHAYCVILACRNAQKATEAVSALTRQTGNARITSMELDLASLDSIRRFAAAYSKAALPPLYALVCNAGLIMVDRMHRTADGFELTFGVNHLGHFLLANLLLGSMADAGRIVFVSSGTHDPANKTIVAPPVYESAQLLAYPAQDSQEDNVLKAGQLRYSTSKLCNIYCAYELAERITEQTDKHITVNAFDPGEMPGTGFSRSFPAPFRVIAKYMNYVSTLFKSTVNTPGTSGKALAALVTDPGLGKTTGAYFEGTRERKSSELSYNRENQKDLWNTSVALTKLCPEESIVPLR